MKFWIAQIKGNDQQQLQQNHIQTNTDSDTDRESNEKRERDREKAIKGKSNEWMKEK